jgi:hypothetical protein
MNPAGRVAVLTFGAVPWGIAWAASVGLVEYLSVVPIDDWNSSGPFAFFLLSWVMPCWCVIGVLFVRLADSHERLASRTRLMAGFLALCAGFSIVSPLLTIGLSGLVKALFPQLDRYGAVLRAVQPSLGNWPSFSLYTLWETGFFGALLVAARILAVRAEHTRHLLHESAMARSRAEALLDDARLQALQSQIDPNLLLESMQELEQRYRISPDSAERLLVALVEFLRHAMHGLRVPVSTVGAELRLARMFSKLQQERGIPGSWRVAEESSSSASTQLRFPSLLMLQLLALGGDGRQSLLRFGTEGERTVLSLHGLSRTVPAELRRQLQARLYALYGERFQFESDPPAPHQVRITLPAPTLPLGELYG